MVYGGARGNETTMKKGREHRAPIEFNLMAVREAFRRYQNNLKITKRRHSIQVIEAASN